LIAIAKNNALILWFNKVGIQDVALVGGKNASLGEMYRNLNKKGINIPNGFAITATAYRYFIERNELDSEIRKVLKGLNTHKLEDLAERGRKVRELILHAKMPNELQHAISVAYNKMCREYGKDCDVAVRSSATAEDLPNASFAGQQETFLNIRGPRALMEAVQKCFASLFTNRAISYRVDKKFDQFKVYLSVGVQKMVRSDKATAGAMFTLDTESGFRDVVFINGSYGLGENVVKGAVNPDAYMVFKPTLKKGFKPIIEKKSGDKKIKMVYTHEGSKSTKNIPVSKSDRVKFVLSDEEILTLAKWGIVIEDHYSEKAGKAKPMDIEWAKDGVSGKMYIVQARPETVHSQKNTNIIEKYKLQGKGKEIVSGSAIGSKIGQGRANVILDVHDMKKFKPNDVLVTDITDPDWEPIMKIASAIVTNRGGRTSHAAIVSRELGIPAIVGTNDATKKIKTGDKITASCAEGEKGKVYKGLLKFTKKEINVEHIPETHTQIMINIGNPEEALSVSSIPNKGVGLAREEFITGSYIRIHPLALLNYKELDGELKKKIDKLTPGYKDKKQFFIDKMARGIGTIAAAFYPNDVIVRLSDFKSNEYANLLGGMLYEPHEQNPMIGWRGASRYYSPKYSKAFAMECAAFKKVREEFGLTNVKIMVPMCRTVEEGKKVLKEMEKNGLKKGKKGLEVYMMVEVPSNVILADKFSEIFDGFSIGSNDLTQLTLGIDRDSELISHIFDENNEAVKRMIRQVIETVNAKHKKIGICGDAPSSIKGFAEFLVDCGINSISLSPDAVIETTLRVDKKEKELRRK